MDRGYWGIDLVYMLKSKGIDVVCRLGVHLKQVKKMIAENLTNYVDTIKCLNDRKLTLKFIRYTITKENNDGTAVKTIDYFLATTIMGVLDLPITFAELYHDRWTIETHFRLVKYGLSLSSISSELLVHIKQDVLLHLIISIILETVYFFATLKLPKKYTIDPLNSNRFICKDSGNIYSLNKQVLLSIVCESILPTLTDKFTTNTINSLEKALNVAICHKLMVLKDIHYDRIKKKSSSGWARNKNPPLKEYRRKNNDSIAPYKLKFNFFYDCNVTQQE